ncbi:maleylpyruvate isomerase N-terminal domain-containing protein [Mycolicibacterium stellerae]|uniref:maleylpyruvate isomerase N-terminal domain-containing protein n=1 Tax=Mycolicibacterium stellerae TaxID=2358193 RepID=UPI000F0BC035|nr:maleylpyruvate isomerase N-terminal domain-containing protein [Mycolicibacterium stellerae]
MTSAPVRITGPAEDARRTHKQAKDALRAAVARTAELLRRVDPASPVPGLTWTAAETAAHMAGELRDYALALNRHTGGYMTHANRPMETPSRMSAVVNARQLTEVPERDTGRLAVVLTEASLAYLAAADAADESAAIPTANGLLLSPPTMTSLLLGEQVVHGLDIARAASTPWDIEPRDALLVIPGVLSVAPEYLRPSAAAARVSFELRIRGANQYRMAVDHGTAVVTAAGAKPDCVITADPVAFLLLGYGRISQWGPIMRGKLRAGGRKPWLAMKFTTLLASP